MLLVFQPQGYMLGTGEAEAGGGAWRIYYLWRTSDFFRA